MALTVLLYVHACKDTFTHHVLAFFVAFWVDLIHPSFRFGNPFRAADNRRQDVRAEEQKQEQGCSGANMQYVHMQIRFDSESFRTVRFSC